jgi:hypothetical protein
MDDHQHGVGRGRTWSVLLAVAVVVSVLLAVALFALLPLARNRVSARESPNWAGYVIGAVPGAVADVKGSWIVPAVQGRCPSTNAYAAFWVGIDGYGSTGVEQTGTDSDCVAGAPTYYAWYEFFPATSHSRSNVPIHPGDVISAEVQYSGGAFTVTIADRTTGGSFRKSALDSGAARLSAEWIVEAPSSAGGIVPLADFGAISFGYDDTGVAGGCSATVSGTNGAVGSFDSSSSSVLAIAMGTSSGATKAATSSLSSDGTSFTVTWVSAGP